MGKTPSPQRNDKASGKHPVSSLPRWPISRIPGTPAVVVGTVEAHAAESAIKEAIRLYGITNPEQQKQLAARRVR